MTKYEKLSLESVAGALESISSLFQSDGAKSELLGLHLPGLSPEQRFELQNQKSRQIAVAEQLKQHAKTLKSIASQ